MADSTRRSGRATKGQHSKNLEPEELPPAPKRGGRGRKKNEPSPEAEESEQPAKIRCICGYVEEDEDDERKMICCESCDAWQHNECMEVSENDDELPEKYFCEECRPKDHKTLLAKVARGEKPWEERAKQRERDEEEKKSRKGKGKKGKRGRPSAASKKDEQEANGTVHEEIESSHIEENSEPAPVSPVAENNKRKQPDNSGLDKGAIQNEQPPSKTRKVSGPPPSKPATAGSRRKSSSALPAKMEPNPVAPQIERVKKISELQSEDRRKAATAMVKMLTEETKKAEKAGSFNLPMGQTLEDFVLDLGLLVEYAIYLGYWGNANKPSEQYSSKFRGILFNVKANPGLRDRLLDGSLSAADLAKMSSDDMASKDLQEKKAEMLKEAEKQHTLIQDEGPRIRRTHKGEELVDDQSHVADGPQTAFAAPIRKRPSEIDTTMKDASPEPMSAISSAPVELPPNLASASPVDRPSAPVKDASPPQQSPGPQRTPSGTKFNIQNVLSQIKGPDTEAQRPKPTPRPSETPAPPVPQQADAEIDQLLKDEEPDDEEPYSPKEFTGDAIPGMVWQGSLGMPGVATFRGKAKHCAGADLSSSIAWSDLVPKNLGIQGRIDVDRASNYLCGLKWSTTTDLVVISVTPDGTDDDVAQFNKLFKYFTERNRYGVISKDPGLNSAVRDIYLIPLEEGTSKKPEFIELLDMCTLSDPTSERMLLLSFVVKLGNSPSAQQTPKVPDAASMASPIGNAGGTVPTPLGNYPGFPNAAPPPNMQYSGPAYQQYPGAPHSTQNSYPSPQNQPQPSQYSATPPQPPTAIGMDAARYVLGDLANAEAVKALLAEVPATGVPEFNVIKGLLDQNAALANDYGALKDVMHRQYRNN